MAFRSALLQSYFFRQLRRASFMLPHYFEPRLTSICDLHPGCQPAPCLQHIDPRDLRMVVSTVGLTNGVEVSAAAVVLSQIAAQGLIHVACAQHQQVP